MRGGENECVDRVEEIVWVVVNNSDDPGEWEIV